MHDNLLHITPSLDQEGHCWSVSTRYIHTVALEAVTYWGCSHCITSSYLSVSEPSSRNSQCHHHLADHHLDNL